MDHPRRRAVIKTPSQGRHREVCYLWLESRKMWYRRMDQSIHQFVLMARCWPNVYNAGPTLMQYRVNVYRLFRVCYFLVQTSTIIMISLETNHSAQSMAQGARGIDH